MVNVSRQKTEEHFNNPEVNDRFTEMCAYWFEVLSL